MALATGAAISNEFALVAAFAREVGQHLAAAIAERAPGIFDSYRPELHYMRGPGPKWRAKQGLAPAKDSLFDVQSAGVSHIRGAARRSEPASWKGQQDSRARPLRRGGTRPSGHGLVGATA